jgi:hypothetical protein
MNILELISNFDWIENDILFTLTPFYIISMLLLGQSLLMKFVRIMIARRLM